MTENEKKAEALVEIAEHVGGSPMASATIKGWDEAGNERAYQLLKLCENSALPLRRYGWTYRVIYDAPTDHFEFLVTSGEGSFRQMVTAHTLLMVKEHRMVVNDVLQKLAMSVRIHNTDMLREELDVMDEDEVGKLFYEETDDYARKTVMPPMMSKDGNLDRGVPHPRVVFKHDADAEMVEAYLQFQKSAGLLVRPLFTWIMGHGQVPEEVLWGIPPRVRDFIRTVKEEAQWKELSSRPGLTPDAVSKLVEMDREKTPKF